MKPRAIRFSDEIPPGEIPAVVCDGTAYCTCDACFERWRTMQHRLYEAEKQAARIEAKLAVKEHDARVALWKDVAERADERLAKAMAHRRMLEITMLVLTVALLAAFWIIRLGLL